jgi:peptide/nickel transport system substrate-binding protein
MCISTASSGTLIPDPATAAAALQAGEMDWWEAPAADLWGKLRTDKRLVVTVQEPTGYLGFLRMNQDIPPFNNPAIRRAVIRAVSQEDYMQAAAGDDPAMWRTGVGFYCPGSPMASDAGMEALTGKRDLAAVRTALNAAGYAGEKVVVLIPTDIAMLKAYGDVGADMLSRAGFTVDPQYLDWGTLVQRQMRPVTPGQNPWHVYHSAWAGLDQWDPAVNTSLRGNGKASGRPGMLDSPKLEALRDAWLAAPMPDEQKRLARQIQLQAFEDVPYILIGQFFAPIAYRNDLTGLLTGYSLFWNVKRG